MHRPRQFASVNVAWSPAGQEIVLAVAWDGTAWASRNGGEWRQMPALPDSIQEVTSNG
jgi:hypothetical protein